MGEGGLKSRDRRRPDVVLEQKIRENNSPRQPTMRKEAQDVEGKGKKG